MATPIKKTPENRNTTRTSVSISGPEYMVVGGAPRGSKAKTRKYTTQKSRVLSRYLRPPSGSCHDLCKNRMKDESLELKRPTRSLGSRKMPVIKIEGVKTDVIPVERMKITKRKPKTSPNLKTSAPTKPIKVVNRGNSLPSKARVSERGSSTNREETKNELKLPKNRPTNVKRKSISSSTVNASARLNGQKYEKRIKTINNTSMVHQPTSLKRASLLDDQNRMTKTKLKQLITEKVQEMSLNEAETAELEFVAPAVEIDQSQTLTIESTKLPNFESFQSSDKQVSKPESEHADDKEVLEEECEYTNYEEVIVSEDDYEMETAEGNCKYRVIICEDKDGGFKLKFRGGKIVKLESEDNDPTRLKFRRGRVLNNDSRNGSEAVTLKHQEMQEKEVQELLNRVIEETASKLVENRKTRVGALVGAFETVISRQEDTPYTG